MNHYSNLADKYDNFYYYSRQYFDYFIRMIIEGLEIKTTERIVEVGAGTGLFANYIQDKFPSCLVTCVDNSFEMLNANKNKKVNKVCLDALSFTRENTSYDKIFMKEFIHHLNNNDRFEFLDGVHSNLASNGIILILIEPKRLDYPLFESALNDFEINQPFYLDIIKELEEISFEVSHTVLEHDITISKLKYLEMVRNRYMSVLSKYSERELELGLDEINLKYGETIVYKEIFYCIKGIKHHLIE